jgi:hypothetical protein
MGNVNDTQELQALIADLQVLLIKYNKVTRDFYRDKGAFPERVWNKHFSTFSEFKEAAAGSAPDLQNEEKQTFTNDKWELSFPKTPIHTLDELLEYCKVDLGIWAVERFTVNKWDGPVAGGGTQELYQVKASLVKRRAVVDAREEIEKLKAELKKEASHVPTQFPVGLPTDNMLEINVPDAHFGKMAWGKETMGRPYDTGIAAATFLRAVKSLVVRASGYNYSKILFVVGNDLLNSDNEQGTTTKGTFVSTDGRYQKTFVTVRNTITEAIEILRQIAPVEVVMVSGNHDDLGVWHLGDSLECLYAKNEDVLIRNEPTARKYVRFGSNFLMFTHGDKGKREDYPLLMATERPKDFGETRFREIHTGHIHQTKLQEWHGVRVRILPSLSPPDAWHSENGFTGQQRNAEGYIWNGVEGLVGIVYHNDDAYPEITTERIITENA